jgi:hypothetical protein
MRLITTLLLSISSFWAMAQGLSGTIKGENNQPVILGAVLIKQNGVLKEGACTDYYGNYSIKTLEPGVYDVIAFYDNYDTVTITGVPVTAGQTTALNFSLSQTSQPPRNIIRPFRKITTDMPGTVQTMVQFSKECSAYYRSDKNESVISGAICQNDIVVFSPSAYESKKQTGFTIGGGGMGIVDGVQLAKW